MKYDVIYDCDDCRGITEIFEGDWFEMKVNELELPDGTKNKNGNPNYTCMNPDINIFGIRGNIG